MYIYNIYYIYTCTNTHISHIHTFIRKYSYSAEIERHLTSLIFSISHI